MCLWTVRRSRTTQREPVWTGGEHAKSTQRGPSQSNLGPSCYEVTALQVCKCVPTVFILNSAPYSGRICTFPTMSFATMRGEPPPPTAQTWLLLLSHVNGIIVGHTLTDCLVDHNAPCWLRPVKSESRHKDELLDIYQLWWFPRSFHSIDS